MTALETYERLGGAAPDSWAVLAADLRSAADRCTGEVRRKCLDCSRACEVCAIMARSAVAIRNATASSAARSV